ncbi:hypothetical protein SAMN05446635_8402 [Burkholderia sp. OK233]|nr:hypothetical protein SAMN05446635_8402 [Burkholderia sp. OK233]
MTMLWSHSTKHPRSPILRAPGAMWQIPPKSTSRLSIEGLDERTICYVYFDEVRFARI